MGPEYVARLETPVSWVVSMRANMCMVHVICICAAFLLIRPHAFRKRTPVPGPVTRVSDIMVITVLYPQVPLFLWHLRCESAWHYRCTYMPFALCPGKKFISTLVPSGWVLQSRGCGSVRLHSPLCGVGLQPLPPFPYYALGSTISPQLPRKKEEKKQILESETLCSSTNYLRQPPARLWVHTSPLLYPICQTGSVCKRYF